MLQLSHKTIHSEKNHHAVTMHRDHAVTQEVIKAKNELWMLCRKYDRKIYALSWDIILNFC